MKHFKNKLPFVLMSLVVLSVSWGCEEPVSIPSATELSFKIGKKTYKSETRHVEMILSAPRYFLYTFEIDGQPGFGFATNEFIVSGGDELYLDVRMFFDSAFDVGRKYHLSDVINDRSYFCLSNYLYLSYKDEDSRDYYATDGWIEFDSLEMSGMGRYSVNMKFEFVAEDLAHQESIHIKNGKIKAAISVKPSLPTAYMRFIE